jgi:hypothetical protein
VRGLSSLSKRVEDRFEAGQVVPDQSGPGVKTFTFDEPMDLIVVRCSGSTGRADPFGGNPSVSGSLGVLCEDGVPTYLPIHTDTVKVDLPDGATANVYGFRYAEPP